MSWSRDPELKKAMGTAPLFMLMVCLSPIFFLMALLYVCNHPCREDGILEIPRENWLTLN
jgi:hypothetical protein